MDNKVLNSIQITPMEGKVAVSFAYTEGPSTHFVLPVEVAKNLIDRLNQAYNLVVNRPTGDGVSVSDYAAVRLS